MKVNEDKSYTFKSIKRFSYLGLIMTSKCDGKGKIRIWIDPFARAYPSGLASELETR